MRCRLELVLLALGVVLASGCIAFNDPCQPLVDNPGERVVWVKKGTEIWLDRPNARHANNAIGEAAADAFNWVFQDTSAPVDFSAINGGSIRAEGLCVTRNILKEGALTNGVLHEILLFQNLVVAAELSEQDVRDMFEHSAERLYASSTTTISLPAGSFLQVSDGVTMTLDCSQPVGSRIAALSVAGKALQKPGRPSVKFQVALPKFLWDGNDGFSMLAGKADTASRQAQRYSGIDSDITAAYLKQSPFNSAIESGLTVAPRVTFLNCATAVRPQ